MVTLRSRRTRAPNPTKPAPTSVFRGRVSKPRPRPRLPKPSKPLLTSSSPPTSPTTTTSASQLTPNPSTPSPPPVPIARASEYNQIKTLLTTALNPSNPSASLYICGTPGTGKTLTVSSVIQTLHIPHSSTKPQTLSLNCAHIRTPQHLFLELASLLKLETGDPRSALRTFATTPGPRIIIVLDEVDFLVSRDQMVLYSAFEWPHLQASRILTVGIANAVDLPVRLLPWLRATGCMPHVISFKPYDATALQDIVKMRMSTEEGELALSEVAVKLAAKKVAAGSGDARLVLDVCRETVRRVRSGAGKDIMVVGQVMESRGGGGKAVETIRALPVVQQLAVVVAANAVTFGGKKRAGLGGLYDSFRRMCERVKVSVVRWDEFVEMCCGALVHQGVLEVAAGRGKKKSAEGRLVRLSVSVDDVRLGLEGKAFLPMLIAR